MYTYNECSCLPSAGLVSKMKYCEVTGKLEYDLMEDKFKE